MSPEKASIEEKLAPFDERSKPKSVGGLNGQHVTLVESCRSSGRPCPTPVTFGTS